MKENVDGNRIRPQGYDCAVQTATGKVNDHNDFVLFVNYSAMEKSVLMNGKQMLISTLP